jgi:hypothetical protein
VKLKLALITALCILLLSCKNSEPAVEVAEQTFSVTTFSFESAEIKGDTLYTTVSYSGGCGEHIFELEANGTMMKSLPPKQPLRIIHRSTNDPCRAHIVELHKFDISSYRGTPTGLTIILLENWNQHLSYNY